MCGNNPGVLESKHEALGYTIEIYRCKHCNVLTDKVYKFNGQVININDSSVVGLVDMSPNDRIKILEYEVGRLRDIIDVLKTHILGKGIE